MSFDLTIRLLGTEVLAITIGKPDPSENTPAMEGGSGHNFERDPYPPDPSGEQP